MDTTSVITEYIAGELSYGRDTAPVAPGQSLISAGILDSVGLLKLLLFVEERFAVKVEDGEVVPDNFETVERIAAFVERKRASADALAATAPPDGGERGDR